MLSPAMAPRQVSPGLRIYQAELSSYCNMKCSYCPHPSMKRTKGYMDSEVLAACLAEVKKNGGDRIVLHHFGEPLMHPQLADRLGQVAASGLGLQISTNALLIDRAWDVLTKTPTAIRVMVSVHQWVNREPSDYLIALNRLQERAAGTNLEIIPAYNFKGGIFTFHRWTRGEEQNWDVAECPFIKYNLAVVLWNGDIAACCVDHEGVTVRGNILRGGAEGHVTTPWYACAGCDVGRLMQGETY